MGIEPQQGVYPVIFMCIKVYCFQQFQRNISGKRTQKVAPDMAPPMQTVS